MPLAGLRKRAKDRLSRLDDALLRWLLRGMIAVTAAILVLDYAQMRAQGEAQEQMASLPPVSLPEAEPDISKTTVTELLPSVRREHKPLLRRGDDRLKSAMSFDLRADGRLIATGTIRPGTAKVFAAEIEKRGSYVKTVVLHSPGGSVSDAIEMGRLIRQHQFATEGGLISYGSDPVEQYRRAAAYVDRVLGGAKPIDLPVRAPTRISWRSISGQPGGSASTCRRRSLLAPIR